MTSTLDFSSLRLAVTRLSESVATASDSRWMEAQTSAVRNVVLAGVIQNFEFVYELSVRMIRRQLEQEAASPEEVDASSFRQLLRAAAERGLVEDVEAWFGYRQMRNLTSHAYDQAKAMEVWAGVPSFLAESERLLDALQSREP